MHHACGAFQEDSAHPTILCVMSATLVASDAKLASATVSLAKLEHIV
jgi:hypothetical protein